MNQRERMLAGLPYIPMRDGLWELYKDCHQKIYRYNNLPPDAEEERDALLRSILGKCGKTVTIMGPFYCDYGFNIELGERFYANYNFTVLDVAPVTIGDNVLCAPNVAIYTAGHPLHPESRNSGYEYGAPVCIGNNVWLGGNVVINPGVTVGDNVVIGSGSVVTHDIADNTLAAGNPCRPLRAITEADRDFYFKDRRFDVDDYKEPWWERQG
ncbi:MAG: sugar O-acetyltransferase [Desulfovibrio sp.]|uniref:sugar O-acetyltransferase n=1 Tax=Desulfovibrio sp. TaxID=885 RepID=UPI001A6A1315|nr:sugar O-acetyltransferase [Desulfovibrio sp.]MBD5418024.1 sugar O-acetyltransferase [Desulfovibrio sp.]